MKIEYVLTENAVVQPDIKKLTKRGPGPEASFLVLSVGLVKTPYFPILK